MKVLVTAGPTREPIDDVRYVSNASTGRMGYAIADAAAAEGHDTVLVTGPVMLTPPAGIEVLRVTTALEMEAAVRARFDGVDAVLMTAAVADYRPEARLPGKRKKTDGPWDLRLVPNPDILAGLGREKGARVLLGFALEAADGEENARRKLAAKRLDFIVLNAPGTIGADASDFLVLGADGSRTPYISVTKEFLAQRLVSLVVMARLGRHP
jgi:phosphopantothenoylcysteine decarboxylase/phosphopantothenate--cysteine ligase